MTTMHIDVCVCTLNRPEMLSRLLGELAKQETGGAFSFSVVVTDNDAAGSARAVVERCRQESGLAIVYCIEPIKNIALARNRALRHATGEFVAFIDDDEFPEPVWLRTMLAACTGHGAAGVLGPVRPHFEQQPPTWIIKGRFCERPEHPTGRVMKWDECRTGNVLFRQAIIQGDEAPFRQEFGSGGEDKDFFMRMTDQGHIFIWCNEGVAYETVPRERWTRTYMIRRALLRGRNILKHPGQRMSLLAKSLLAVPLYVTALPFTLLMGHHVFMQCCVRCCDHVGRLLGAVGLNPVKSR